MKDARKALALIIAFAMLFGMVSCSTPSKSKKSKSDKKTEKEEDEDDVTEETETSEETKDTEESETSEETEETEDTEETGDSSGTSAYDPGSKDNSDFDRLEEITGADEIEPGAYYFSLNKEDVIASGVIVYAEGEDMEDVLDHMLYLGSSLIPDDIAEDMNLYECKSVISFAKESKNEIGGDHECLSIYEYEDEAAANAAFETFRSSAVGDQSLNEDEYMNTGSGGYLIFNIGSEALMHIIFGDLTDEELEEYKAFLGDMNVLIGIYQSGNRIIEIDYVSIAGDCEFVSLPFILDEGFSDPFLVENSEAMVTAYEEVFDD